MLRLNSRQILFNDTFDEKDGPILKIKPSTHIRHRSRRSNVNWALDRQSQTPDKTPTQIYVVTETITDNVPQHLNAGLVPVSRPNFIQYKQEASTDA
ncbi:hypothetical protein JR316_0010020 [Psilocybe cubensis]|uniref:Uncharacterized protein n=1 Tax=Psilocybe cubensis TaxID=181762 RepID=A0ACB8GRE2_PSICU|nr:hypothetical protein JR316_0010020 [Psilocybe cubensis]KAH9477791.1 hypothetical protein JR316_0010020 [Psilocybe cubensis]